MKGFNPKNGQVYTETTSSPVRSMVPTWKKHVTGGRVDPQSYKNGSKGSGSLRDMAMRSCCWNIELFMPEALHDPGWHYAGMIYRHLKATDTLSFSAWTLFEQAYPSQPELQHTFRITPLDATTSWPSVIESLSTLNTNILTRFCAYGLDLHFSHLMSLTDIPTLAALIHVHPSPRSSSALSKFDVRNWCRAVREKKAFQKLRLLLLSSVAVTEPGIGTVLDHFAQFPALRLVGMSRRATGSTDLSEIHGSWVRPCSTDVDELSGTVWGSHYSIAEKTERLYEYAARELPTPGRDADASIAVSLTCVSAQHVLYNNESMSWFVRNHAATETQPKRLPEAQDRQDGNGRGLKKRKVRQGKQQDVGSLLETFG